MLTTKVKDKTSYHIYIEDCNQSKGKDIINIYIKDHNLLTVRVDTVNKGTLDSTILLAPRLLGLRLEKRGDRTL